MPHRRVSNKAPAERDGDPFRALPDAVVQHVLGFLPARDAVRACAVARRLRPLWRSTPRLRVAGVEALGSVWSLNRFVRRLLLLREPSAALDECEFDLRGFSELDGACVDLWIRHGSMCRVRVLQIRLYTDERVQLADWPLFSSALVRLELHGLAFFLDFSSCPILECLKITNCQVDASKIFSRSLNRLEITGCELCIGDGDTTTYISVPSLVSLQLDDYVGLTPILESMPLLETASVKLGHNNEEYRDFCDGGDGSGECICSMAATYYNANGSRNDVCFLLGGLSNVTYLELKASSEMLAFKRDLRCCPTFNKLKILLLNDWCLVADLHALVCFLQCTPVLEKLILHLCKPIRIIKIV
ncbi:LOW QUALITY PROTEIN: hypothetical protein U9M48_004487 [Paspalum notatum var. saurae]|uniref:F-box domain-containing protein n=1 Tax=Paspalum notatum var. saurae TaxID=547442 RepID=A0AAQ3PK11_PASNO